MNTISPQTLSPLIVGRGLAGQAIEKALLIVKSLEPELPLGPIHFAHRSKSASENLKELPRCIPFIALPHALHCDWIKAADALEIPMIFSEKPVAVNADQIKELENIRARVAVFHGYRMMWGPQTVRRMIDQGEVGKVFGIECRYWQSSQAARFLEKSEERSLWKNDTALAGAHDVLLDLGTHWMDLVRFLWTPDLESTSIEKFHPHTESENRDSHVSFYLKGRDQSYALGSASKSMHGAGNDLEIVVMGSRRSLSWSFANPDQIVMGQGRESLTVTRTSKDWGSALPTYHASGWLEGYVEIIRRGLKEMIGKEKTHYPTLGESLALTRILLNT